MKDSLRRARRFVFVLSLCVAAVSASHAVGGRGQQQQRSGASQLTETERRAALSLSVETIRRVTTDLAAPAMQGRGTGQPGGEKAAQYLAERFAGLGLKPFGDARRSYLQSIRFRAAEVLPQSSLIVDEEALALGTEFVFAPSYAAERADVNARLFFVGYGRGKERPDVRGKIVVMLHGVSEKAPSVKAAEPKDKLSPEVLSGITGLWINIYASRGAAGIIVVQTKSSADEPYRLLADYSMRRRVTPVPVFPVAEISPAEQFYTTDKTRGRAVVSSAVSSARQEQFPPVVFVSPRSSEKLFAGTDLSLTKALAEARRADFEPRPLRGATIRVRMKIEETTGSNVVGLLEGRDPLLRDQAVVYTAHYDAFGMAPDGRIYPGAADNALGVGEMLAIAEAFAGLPARPRRSVIFLATTGEEYGLLGAKHWEGYPSWPAERLAAVLNFDGAGTETYGPVRHLVGYGAEHSELGEVLGQVAAAMNLSLAPDPVPEERLFYRSDHYEFALHGVPPLMLVGLPADAASAVARARGWSKTDYHQPSDTVRAEWDWGGARTLAAVGLVVGMRVAEAEAPPEWSPSSPYRRFRKTSDQPASAR